MVESDLARVEDKVNELARVVYAIQVKIGLSSQDVAFEKELDAWDFLSDEACRNFE